MLRKLIREVGKLERKSEMGDPRIGKVVQKNEMEIQKLKKLELENW